ncbi:MAG: glycosyltransferase [Egibacteraceae bacterium]
MKPSPAELRVLAWPAYDNQDLNPYNALLYTHLARLGVVTDDWSRPRLRSGRYDVLHLHWPEWALGERRTTRALSNLARWAADLRRCRAQGVKIVWTVHNLRSHARLHPWLEWVLWRLVTRSLDGWISLSDTGEHAARERFPLLCRLPSFVVPHGEYRSWYPHEVYQREARSRLDLPQTARVLTFFGRVRAYKNVLALIQAFGHLADKEARLVIAGEPEPPELAAHVERAAARDARIVLRLGLVPADEVQLVLTAADLVVLPYQAILNSGAAMLALSFERPVLVPMLGSLGELRDRAGADHVRTYTGPLTATVLGDALAWSATRSGLAPPNLGFASWPNIARLTRAAYLTVCSRPGFDVEEGSDRWSSRRSPLQLQTFPIPRRSLDESSTTSSAATGSGGSSSWDSHTASLPATSPQRSRPMVAAASSRLTTVRRS